MERKIFLKCLENEFEWLLDLGFSYHHLDSSVFFEKRVGKVDFCINFFWAEYNAIKIQGLFALKRFNIIEEIIENITGKLDYTIRISLLNDDLSNVSLSIISPQSEIYLSTEADVREFSELIEILYKTKALPFYEQYETLEDIEKWMNDNDIKDHSQFLSVSNNSMMLRKLIILKEIKSKDFTELYSNYKTYLIKKNEEGGKVYQEMYNCFCNFKDYFETPPA